MAPEKDSATQTPDPESSIAGAQSQTPAMTLATAMPASPGPDGPRRVPLSSLRPAYTNVHALRKHILRVHGITLKASEVRDRVTPVKPDLADEEDQDSSEADAVKEQIDTA
ncbi:hypothetical protein LX36DRAFT_709111 [Colletotrichum falcatum]|nr:hypothetical protein LX36DRAFT_709111 [Colletotrichum falcatum]